MGSIQISILVIDDDATSLNVVAGYLQRMNHHVVAMRSPNDALCTLRMNPKEIDLILTDVHMPEMSGLDLLKHVVEEFQLPVVLMSDDCDKDIMLKGLEEGASFYLVKPVTEERLRTIWQFAISGDRFWSSSSANWNTITSTSSGDTSQTETTIHGGCCNDNNDSSSGSFTTNVDADSNQVKDTISKKPKLIWTTSLHNLFLEAVNKIGLERAVPKRILEYMNVPGLRRENVASHLQKYRIFLKRISEASYSEYGIPIDGKERPLRSSFVLNEITYLANNIQQQYKDLFTQRAKDTIMRNDEPLFNVHQEEISIEGDCTHGENYHDTLFNNNPKNGSFQLPTSNYVGLRINSNGELVGTLNNLLPSSCDLEENNSIKGVLSEGSLNTIVASENVDTYNNISQNASLPSFEMNDVTLGGVDNEPCLGDLDNLNLYVSNNIDFGFGSFDGLDDGLGGHDPLDQDDIMITKQD